MKDFLDYCWERQRPTAIVAIVNILYVIAILIMLCLFGTNSDIWESPIFGILNTFFISYSIGYAIYSVAR